MSQRNQQLEYPLHVLIAKYKGGGFTAYCLEFDLTVDADSLEKAIYGLADPRSAITSSYTRQNSSGSILSDFRRKGSSISVSWI